MKYINTASEPRFLNIAYKSLPIKGIIEFVLIFCVLLLPDSKGSDPWTKPGGQGSEGKPITLSRGDESHPSHRSIGSISIAKQHSSASPSPPSAEQERGTTSVHARVTIDTTKE